MRNIKVKVLFRAWAELCVLIVAYPSLSQQISCTTLRDFKHRNSGWNPLNRGDIIFGFYHPMNLTC